MKRRTPVLVMMLLAWATVSACAEGDPADLNSRQQTLLADAVVPADGPLSLELRLDNVGGQPATLVRAFLVNPAENRAGAFSLDAEEVPGTIEAGESIRIPVRFFPSSDATPGCGLLVTNTLRITYLPTEDSGFRQLEIPLLVSGDCDRQVRCSDLDFGAEIVGETSEKTLSCFYLADSGADSTTLEQVGFASEDSAFSFKAAPRLPIQLESGEKVEIDLSFAPTARQAYSASLTARFAEREPIEIAVRGTGIGERPLCSEPTTPPSAPQMVDSYQLELAEEAIRAYGGQVVSIDPVNESYARLLERAVLTGTGAFLNEGCEATNDGARWRWSGGACEIGAGTLFNIITISADDVVDAGIRRLELGDNVRFEGYEIERITDRSPGGGYWYDGGGDGDVGNVTLYVTRVCDLAE